MLDSDGENPAFDLYLRIQSACEMLVRTYVLYGVSYARRFCELQPHPSTRTGRTRMACFCSHCETSTMIRGRSSVFPIQVRMPTHLCGLPTYCTYSTSRTIALRSISPSRRGVDGLTCNVHHEPISYDFRCIAVITTIIISYVSICSCCGWARGLQQLPLFRSLTISRSL